MPEGDTIWRTAWTLRGVLVGRTVTGFTSPLPEVAAAALRLGLVGQTVAAVESNGKHLLLRFSGGATLHTHQRMTGSWHLYRAGTPWRKRARAARVALETAEVTAVCFSVPVVDGNTVQRRLQGELGRSTYWCPVCQPADRRGGRQVSSRIASHG